MSSEGRTHRWVLRDRDGNEMRATQDFDSQRDAEEWLGSSWAALLGEGTESVVLMDEDAVVYEMSLRPAGSG